MLNSYTRKGELPQSDKILNDSKNISTISPPEITSTPFHISKTRTSPLVTPTRKILGPRRYALSSNGTFSPLKTIKDPPGPLLTSTSYNVNVSTYIDTKSPGYTGRLVQYSEEASRNKQHTHQEKYGSPGLFPIVHLFKKDIPVISPKLKKPTVRIGTPELKSPYSQEHKRLLLEGIVRNSPHNNDKEYSNEVSTRSVLDALKEISRKRIHASEDYEDLDEANKKLRRDCVNGDGDSSKRNRVDSPQSDASTSPPTRQVMKKLCTIDAVLASRTSSMYASYESSNKRKTSEESKAKISPVNKKKFNNAETQTLITPVQKKISPAEQLEKTEKREEQEHAIEIQSSSEIISPPKQVLKVFDDKPLEIIRKNRLGALLSALTGHEIPPIPMEDRRKALDQDWPPQKSDKKLVSILSPQNRQVKTIEKHVTFNLPDSSTHSSNSVTLPQNSSTPQEENSVSQNKPATSSEHSNKNEVECDKPAGIVNKLDTTVGDGTTVVSSSEGSPSSFKLVASNNASDTSKNSTVGGFKFDLNKPVVPLIKDSSDNSSTSNSTYLNDSTPISKESNSGNQAQKSMVTSSSNGMPPFSSPTSFLPKFAATSQSEVSSKTSSTNMANKTSANSPNFNSLGLPSSLPSFGGLGSPSNLTFGTTQVAPSSSLQKNPVFCLAASKTVSSPASVNTPVLNISSSSILTNSIMTSMVSSVTQNSSMFNSGIPTSISISKSNENATRTPTFGTSTATSGFSSSNLTTNALNCTPSRFAAPLSTSSFETSSSSPSLSSPASKNVFTTTPFPGALTNSTTSAPNFKSSSTVSGAFNLSTGNSLPAFSTSCFAPTSGSAIASFPTATSASISAASPPFGSNKTFSSSQNSTSGNTVPNTSSMFGTTPTLSAGTNSIGGSSKPFTFGATNTSNNTQTSTNTSSMFTLKNSQSGMTLGTNTTASTASNLPFSTAATFGTIGSGKLAQNTGNGFGQNSTVSTFGTTTTPSFGATTTLSFGPTANPSFLSSINPSFAATTTSAFGATTTPSFGATTTPSFGATTTPAFGATTTPAFGATTTPSFGATTTPAFGATTTPAFGATTNSAFGAVTKAPSFGSSNTLNFGTPTTSAPVFGSTLSSFGAPSTTSSLFIGTNPAFGTTNTTSSGFGTGNSLTFGPSSTGASTFGTNTPTFGAPTTSSVFGTTNSLSFGNPTTTAAFGTTNTPSFGGSNGFGGQSFATNPLSFGAPTTTSVNTFNSNNSASPFGTSSTANGFGAFGSTNSPFGTTTSTSSFGSNTSNAFGISTAAGAFGTPTATNNNFGNSSGFGSAPNVNPFGNEAAKPNTFGFGTTNPKPDQSSNIFPSQTSSIFNSNSTFGSNQTTNLNTSSTAGGIFTFGSPNAQSSTSTGVFAFGASDAPKTFNFSAPGATGSAPTSTSSGFPGFGQPSNAMPSMFNIGSGASSSSQNRSRPVARAKRRT